MAVHDEPLPTPAEVQALIDELAAAGKAYSDGPGLDSYMGRVQIIAKAKQLARALVGPEQTASYHGLNMAEVVAIRTFMKLKVLDAIPRTGSASLEDLAKATGAQESLLERMGRVLVASGFLDQTRPDGGEYVHTKFSRAYLLDQPGPGHLFLAMYDDWFKNMHNFDDYLAARGQLEHAREPDDALYNPFTYYYKMDGTPVWSIMARDPARLQNFQVSMAGLDVAVPVVGHFDFDVLRNTPEEAAQNTVELVDVGGGRGTVLQRILETHKALTPSSCVLQERPDIIALATETKAAPAGTQLMAHDFFTAQPVKGAKAYFMRMIMHDYSDETCIKILAHIAEAMSPASRVLVCDMVIPSRVNEADFAAAVMDQAVMTMGGKERTQQGFEKLFNAVGIELVHVWRAPGVPGGCVEGRLKQS